MAVALDKGRFKALDLNTTPVEDIPLEVRTAEYNRNTDVLPQASTRVQLSGKGAKETYINANYVRGADGDPKQ